MGTLRKYTVFLLLDLKAAFEYLYAGCIGSDGWMAGNISTRSMFSNTLNEAEGQEVGQYLQDPFLGVGLTPVGFQMLEVASAAKVGLDKQLSCEICKSH